jgi:beta-lactamase class D
MRIRVTSFVEKRKQEYILYIFKVQSKRHWHADTFKIFHLILYFEMVLISHFITKRLKWKTIYRVAYV